MSRVVLSYNTFVFAHIAGDVSHAVGRDLNMAEAAVTIANKVKIFHDLRKSTALQLGPVLMKLKRELDPDGSMQGFIMSRRDPTSAAFSVPRFGVFMGTLRHVGPDGVERLLIHVRWRKVSPQMYHPLIRAPMAMKNIDQTLPTLCLAENIAPFLCFGAVDPQNSRRLIMLCEKNWGCLSMLGFPKIP